MLNGLFAGGGEILREASDRTPALSKHYGSRGEDLLALLAQLTLRPDVPVERHGFDPELSAEFGHGGVALRHRGLEPGHGAFTNHFPFELGQRREDAEHEATGRRGGVDLRALTGEQPQAPAAGRQVLRGVD